jgi:hypothetical protein
MLPAVHIDPPWLCDGLVMDDDDVWTRRNCSGNNPLPFMNITGFQGLHSPGVFGLASRFDSAAPHAVKSGSGNGVFR